MLPPRSRWSTDAVTGAAQRFGSPARRWVAAWLAAGLSLWVMLIACSAIACTSCGESEPLSAPPPPTYTPSGDDVTHLKPDPRFQGAVKTSSPNGPPSADPVVWDVDGEQVQAQAGDFYGGWITSDIVGPFKGEPGTMWW